MPSTSHKLRIPRDPEMFGPSLAHIVLVKGESEEVLGQAWIAAPNVVVTCAHVVDQFVRTPASITVKFPHSGNRYVVRDIKIHPSFQRHEGELLRFDLAAITVDFVEPETNTRPLPVVFEKPIEQHQTLSAIRYPSHLGLYTTSLSPLAQIGSYLGPLKRNDRFHLLHDLALAPGDSGTPLFDGEHVVAIHCGDTATLPGLNLPTTSIRLSLSVDSLMALGISESKGGSVNLVGLIPAVVAFILCAVVTLGAFAFPYKNAWAFSPAPKQAVTVGFNKGADTYKYDEKMVITLTPKMDCDLYVFYVQENDAFRLFPLRGNSAKEEANRQLYIDGCGKYDLQATETEGKVHILALTANLPVLSEDEEHHINVEDCRLPIKRDELEKRLFTLGKEHPDSVLHEMIDAPRAEKPTESEQSPAASDKSTAEEKQEDLPSDVAPQATQAQQ